MSDSLSIAVQAFASRVLISFYGGALGDGSARGVMVIVVGNEHGDTSSNPGQD